MSRPYRPSNGTEGDGFRSLFCDMCERDKNQDCRILSATLAYDVGEPEYPKEWVQDDNAEHGMTARCTAFVPLGEPELTPRCSKTIDLFTMTSDED